MDILTYFSYNRLNENRAIIKEFADLMVENDFALLIPCKTDYSSILRLELMMKDIDCFVGILTDLEVDDSALYLSVVLFEYDLASRANKPCFLLVEMSLQDIVAQRDNQLFFDRNDPLSGLYHLRSRIDILRNSVSPPKLVSEPLCNVGIMMDETKNIHHIYSKEVLLAIKDLIHKHGYQPQYIPIKFTQDYNLHDVIDKINFLVVEGRSSFFSPQIAETLLSRCIPTVRICHIRGNESVETVRARELPSQVAGYDLKINGKRIEHVIFWEDMNQLKEKLTEQLSVIKKKETFLLTHEDIEAFFGKQEEVSELRVIEIPSEPPKVFLSNSSTLPESLIREIIINLDSERIDHFHYGESIPIGADWKKEVTDRVTQCEIFIALINSGYAKSKWCMYELELALDRYEQGEIRIFPYYLDGEHTAIDPKLEIKLRSIEHRIFDLSSYNEIAENIIENYRAACEIYY